MGKSKTLGRPRIYKTVKQLETAINGYFTECEGKALLDSEGEVVCDKNGEPIVVKHPPTISGLAYFLGLKSRQALLNYQDRPEFNDAVTRAKLFVESYTEGRLFDRDGVMGAKFSLTNNFSGWREKIDIDNEDTLKKLDVVLSEISGVMK